MNQTEQQIWDLIDNSQREILAAYYILDDDVSGRAFLARLMKAANRGVRVKLIIDGIGPGPVFPLSRSTQKMLVRSGVQFKIFHPKFRFLFKILNRMHDKLLISDDQVVLGSSNIWMPSFTAYYLESDVLIKESPKFIEAAREHFSQLWNSPGSVERRWKRVGISSEDADFIEQALQAEPQPSSEFHARGREFIIPKWKYVYDGGEKREGVGTFEAIMELIRSAKHQIDIVDPFPMFVDRLKQAIADARERQVSIRILTVPLELFNQKFSGLTAAYLSQMPFFQKMEIELRELPGWFLHSKYIIVDGSRTYLGSANLDSLSADYNTENGLLTEESFEGPDTENTFAGFLQQEFRSLMARSNLIIQDGELLFPDRKCSGFCSYGLFYPTLTENVFGN